MNTAPLIFGLLAAFALIGVLVGMLVARWRPGHGRKLARPILVGLAGAYAGGLLFTLAPLDVEAGLIGAPIAAVLGAAAAIRAVSVPTRSGPVETANDGQDRPDRSAAVASATSRRPKSNARLIHLP